MKKDKVTVSDIAKISGVSAATVSRVLNHRDLVKIETIRTVEAAMADLGLTPRGDVLESSDEPIIILNIPSIENDFYHQVIKGARFSAKAHGYHILINESPLDRNSTRLFTALLKQVKAVGTILLNQLSADQLDRIHAVAPLVQCCEYNEESHYPYVSIDDFAAAQSATQYIISCGNNKIAIINGPLNFKYAKKRQEGFLDALLHADISIPQSWLVQLPEVSYQIAYSSVCRLLDAEIRPNAFFVISDIYAAAVIRAAKRFGLKVPDDIIVVGFDNLDISMMTRPSITTVSQPSFQLGYSACELLLDIIDHPNIPPKSLILNTELIIRESTTRQ